MQFFEETRGRSLSLVTKKNYERRQQQFLDWLDETHHVICFDEKEKFYLECVTAEMLSEYIGIVCVYDGGSKDGQVKSVSTAEGHHAAIAKLYKDKKLDMPNGFDPVFNTYNKSSRMWHCNFYNYLRYGRNLLLALKRGQLR